MSLIIASNQPNENDTGGRDSSIFKPYSFRNDMSSTITLPKNSQIALQSAKINIDGSIIVDEGNKFFYVYFGQGIQPPTTPFNLLDDMEQSSAYPIKVYFSPDNKGKIASNPAEFAVKIQEALNHYIAHPQLTNRVVVSQKFGGTGLFEGYDFTFGSAITAQNGGAPNYEPTSFIPQTNTATATYWRRQRYGADGKPQKVPANAIDPPVWTYAAAPALGTFEITQLRQRTQFVTFNVPPLVNKLGVCAFDIADAIGRDATETAKFVVGLSKSSVSKLAATQSINPEGYYSVVSSNAVSWLPAHFNYCCWVDNQSVAAPIAGGYRVDGQLNLSQSVVDSADVGPQRWRESYRFLPRFKTFEYWNLGASQSDFDAPVDIYSNIGPQHRVPTADNTKIIFIEFRVDGEVVEVYIKSAGLAGDGSNGVYYKLYGHDDTTRATLQLKPVSQDAWSLYPVMGLNNNRLIGAEQTKSIDIIHWSGANSNYASVMTGAAGVGDNENGRRNGNIGWVQGIDRTTGASDFNTIIGGGWLFPEEPGGYMSWNQRCEAEGQSWRIHDLTNRPFMDRGNVIYTDATAPRLGLNPVKYGTISGAVPALGYDLQKPVLILQDSRRYSPSEGAGFQQLFGFQGNPIVDGFKLDAGNINFEVVSTSIPQYISTKSIFVRVNNLTQSATNMRAGQISKIVGHLPRFVQDRQNAAGPLYLEPTNLIYLDLKNSEELKINSLDISLCYVDEKLADSLIGTTIVVFHVREKP